jgi:hypothetical protein
MGYITSVVVYTKYECAQIRWKRIFSDIANSKLRPSPNLYFEMEYDDCFDVPGWSEFLNFRDIFDPQ